MDRWRRNKHERGNGFLPRHTGKETVTICIKSADTRYHSPTANIPHPIFSSHDLCKLKYTFPLRVPLELKRKPFTLASRSIRNLSNSPGEFTEARACEPPAKRQTLPGPGQGCFTRLPSPFLLSRKYLLTSRPAVYVIYRTRPASSPRLGHASPQRSGKLS